MGVFLQPSNTLRRPIEACGHDWPSVCAANTGAAMTARKQ